MQKQILLSFLLVTVFAIIISVGCGGGSETARPVSLLTPTSNYTETGNMIYVTFKVEWPERGKAGKLTMSTSDTKEIISSWIPTPDSHKQPYLIDIYILDYTNDPNQVPWDKVVASGNIHYPDDHVTIGFRGPGSSGPSPAIPVKIYAGLFTSYDLVKDLRGKQIAHGISPVRQLVVGINKDEITLIPNIDLKTTATESQTERYIIASDTGSSNEYNINANLQLMYGTPFPVSTPMGNSSGEISEPMEGQIINFNIIQGSGQLDATQAETDPNGDCKVHFTSASAYNVIEASYQYDPDDPNTIVTSQCTIGDNYELTVDPNNVVLNLPPLYRRNTNMISFDTPTPSSGGPDSVDITAKLNIVYPTPAPNSTATPKPPKPAEGKLIKFEIVEGNDEGTYLSLAGETGPIVSGFTLADGTSTATLTTSTTGYKTIKASFQPDTNDSNNIYSDYCYVTVMASPLFTPTPTETPEPTQTPTVTPTPTLPNLPISYPSYIEGTWQEQYGLYQKPTGKIYNVTVTDTPVYIPWLSQEYLGVKLIITGEDGQIEEGVAVTTTHVYAAEGYIQWKEVDGSVSYGSVYRGPGFSHYGNGGYPGILWNTSNWYGGKHKPWIRSSKIE